MKRLTLRTENQWRSLRDGADADLIRLSLIADRFRVGFAVTLLGFGVGLTYWHKEPELASWGAVMGAALTHTYGIGDGIQVSPEWGHKTYSASWEPIETNGWAGEPQGREHGA